MKFFMATLLLFCFATSLPHTGHAGIYKYRDANGRLIFVDDENKIPVQYRDQAASVEGAPAPPYVGEQGKVEKDVETTNFYDQLLERRAEKQLEEHQTPVIIEKNRVLVPVDVSMGARTVKLNLLLDTGATRTVFHRDAVSELDLPSGKNYKARVAGGGIVRSRKIKFRKIKIGPFEISRTYAMVINLEGRKVPFDGMLGMDFLKSHPYQIDYENKLITWEQK